MQKRLNAERAETQRARRKNKCKIQKASSKLVSNFNKLTEGFRFGEVHVFAGMGWVSIRE